MRSTAAACALFRSRPDAPRSRACPRRRSTGESAEALLVTLTMWVTPARTALSITAISWAGTAGLTSSTVSIPARAASRVSGRSKSPVTTSIPRRVASSGTREGSRTRARAGWWRAASRRMASEPTLPVAPVTRIMVFSFGWGSQRADATGVDSEDSSGDGPCIIAGEVGDDGGDLIRFIRAA